MISDKRPPLIPIRLIKVPVFQQELYRVCEATLTRLIFRFASNMTALNRGSHCTLSLHTGLQKVQFDVGLAKASITSDELLLFFFIDRSPRCLFSTLLLTEKASSRCCDGEGIDHELMSYCVFEHEPKSSFFSCLVSALESTEYLSLFVVAIMTMGYVTSNCYPRTMSRRKILGPSRRAPCALSLLPSTSGLGGKLYSPC